MKWIRRVCFGGMCLLILAKSADAADPDRVLLLHSFGPDFSPWNTITPPFREALRKLAPNPIDLYEASLQAERFGVSPAREEGPFIDYLNALLPDRKPRLIVAMGAPVTRFVLRNRARLFPSSPLLIATSDVRTYEDLALTANDTACPTIYDPTIHIDHILRLLPDTDHIVVAMTGASATEQFWNDLFQRALQRSSRSLTLEWFTPLAADDMVKRVAALPAHSAIFYPTIRVDGRGVPQEGDALLLRFIEEDRAPIFTHTDSLFGHGIVGGPMFSSHEMADTCAKVAVRLLNGETPGDIKMVPVGLAAPRYDWRQLQKWGIKNSLLPPGSEIFFREPTVWERYSWQIALITAVILLQAGLISALLREHRRRRLTAAEKTELWDRWKRGESLKAIGRAFGKPSSSIYFLVAPHGGIRPAQRRRSRLALTLAEREVICRGVTAHQSARSMAKLLGRSPSTVSREMSRNGGYDRYRATLADENAWARARRPKCCKLATNPRLRQAVAGKLRLDWSPEQIAGWLKRTHPEDECVIRCHTRPSIAACLSKRAACSRKSCLAISDRSARCVAPGRLTRMAINGDISRISSQSVSDRRRLKIGRCLVTGRAISRPVRTTPTSRPWSSVIPVT